MNKGLGLIQVLVALAIILAIALLITLYYTAGATPKTLTIDGPKTLVEDQTVAYTLTVVLDGKPGGSRDFEIQIDENDFYDDTLDEFFIRVDEGEDTKSRTFDLTCKELTVGGKFDLKGMKDTSKNEATHSIHAEYSRGIIAPNLYSNDVNITCVFSDLELEGPSDDGNQ